MVIDHAKRLGQQQQAMKGLVRTFNLIRERYCDALDASTASLGWREPPAFRHIRNRIEGAGQISDACSGVNSLHACIGLSVNANCTASAFRELPEVRSNPDLMQHLAPLDEIVEHKVWSIEERTKLFTLCFRILSAFKKEFERLIAEVREVFPEETAEIPDMTQAR